MQSNITDTRRRVKVYQLNEDRQWDDRGTGHVQTHVDQTDGAVSLLVKSETDQQILLDSEIRQDTNYSKQQETLIVWSEDNSDLALSFQERSGCEEVQYTTLVTSLVYILYLIRFGRRYVINKVVIPMQMIQFNHRMTKKILIYHHRK
jgi:hypothetical protein